MLLGPLLGNGDGGGKLPSEGCDLCLSHQEFLLDIAVLLISGGGGRGHLEDGGGEGGQLRVLALQLLPQISGSLLRLLPGAGKVFDLLLEEGALLPAGLGFGRRLAKLVFLFLHGGRHDKYGRLLFLQ